MKNNYLPLIFLVLICQMACEPEKHNTMSNLEKAINSLKQEYAPDKRVALFDVSIIQEEGGFQVKGETNLPEAYEALASNVALLSAEVDLNVALLPHPGLSDNVFALVTISVANIRSQPKHSAELATQATLGTPLRVLKQKGSWYLVQTPDKYLAWVDAGGIKLINSETFEQWKDSEKVIFTLPYGMAFAAPEPSAPSMSDLVGGCILQAKGSLNGFYHIAFPDGREGYIPMVSAQPYQGWVDGLQVTGGSLAGTAKKMMGVPYLWGGTSFKGVDCSGFTKTIYFMNGMVIPRDASQQVHTGVEVDTTGGFEKLEVGDLLFFGKHATDSTKERVIHVAMWLGDNEFIHASGKVRVNSFDPTAENFNAYELNRFLRAKRILKHVAEPVFRLQDVSMYDVPRGR